TLIDIVLAGDNALVIAMAARTLPPTQRRVAIIAGAGLAVVIRVAVTFAVAQLLLIPFLSAIGGLLVGWIAVKLLIDQKEVEESHGQVAKGFWHALWIIAVADFIMSTDNILAIGGASGGDFGLILFGLGLSIPIIMFCAGWIARLMDRYPQLAYVGAGVLGWTAGHMVVNDKKVALLLGEDWVTRRLVEAAFTLAVILIGKWIAERRRHRPVPKAAPLSGQHSKESPSRNPSTAESPNPGQDR
ncbi:MAG TPA: TerC family protein, partial [Candidatus Methylomirabilis sp.]|nr:TerC family protein [Candidatus Methylomirabilis sp.]